MNSGRGLSVSRSRSMKLRSRTLQATFNSCPQLICASIALDGWSHAILRRIASIRENSPEGEEEEKIDELVRQADIKAWSALCSSTQSEIKRTGPGRGRYRNLRIVGRLTGIAGQYPDWLLSPFARKQDSPHRKSKNVTIYLFAKFTLWFN